MEDARKIPPVQRSQESMIVPTQNHVQIVRIVPPLMQMLKWFSTGPPSFANFVR